MTDMCKLEEKNMSAIDLVSEINRLRRERKAVILAHNYQLPEVQDIADFVGDSLGLSQQAAKTQAEVIVFCGVHFMAETASILSPTKTVLIPDLGAGCSLAQSITAEELMKWKVEHPGATVVSYVNTTAEVKALSDYCCTSGNAVKVVESIPREQEILFLPDRYLGQYVETVAKRPLHIWGGACHVHAKILDEEMETARLAHPDADILVHPECGCSTTCMLKSLHQTSGQKMFIYSTEGMLKHVEKSDAKEFLIATEVGIIHRLHKQFPDRRFYPLSPNAVCEYMKMITLPKVYETLRDMKFEVKVEASLAAKARLPVERMITIV